MAEIGGTREPGDEGTMVGDIKTPQCPTNVGRKNTPTVLTYGSIVQGNPGGGGDIMGPGTKNKY